MHATQPAHGPARSAWRRTAVALVAVTVLGTALISCSSGRKSSTSTSTSVATTPSTDALSTAAGDTGASSVDTDASATSASASASDAASTDEPTTDESTTTTEAPTTTTEPPTTTTEPPTTTTTLVLQGAIVIVANATKVPGGAGKFSELMAARGFQMGKATDAAGNEELRDTSQVYCLPGSEAVAMTVGNLLGGIPVNYMPTPVPITDANVGLGDASVLVMLGKDLVGTVPPGLAHG